MATRGEGLRTRAKEIVKQAESRKELIDHIAILLSEIDDLRARRGEK